jgi:single-strand DNA-binding protein
VNGLPVAKFKLAVNRSQGAGTDLIEVVAWRGLAESCADFCRKGQLVLVEGSIQVRSFEDQTGQRRWATEVVARELRMLEKSSVNAKAQTPGAEAGRDEEAVDDSDWGSDLPF